MSAMIRFIVPGQARPKGSTKAFMRPGAAFPIITSDSKHLKAWEKTIGGELQRAMSQTRRDILTGLFLAPVKVTLGFYLPRPKASKAPYPLTYPDLDKLVRGALDALNGVLFEDDKQVVDIWTRKRYADSSPYMEVIVEAIGPPLFAEVSA